MEYLTINYDKLQNMPKIKYFIVVIFIIILCIILLIVASCVDIYKKGESLGIYNDNIISLKINVKLSDGLKKSEYITFNNIKLKFKIQSYGNYEIVDNNIFQEVRLIVDKKFYNNEIGSIKFYYDKKSVLKNIFDLFK